VNGTIAITDFGWYEFLLSQQNIDEVNFWTPSAHFAFRGEAASPFFFKLKTKYDNKICGFAYVAKYSKLPDWLAWDSFNLKNGCPSLESMRLKIHKIRKSIAYQGKNSNEIGCILLSQPHFFKEHEWIEGPKDWQKANLRYAYYDICSGEGLRIWNECLLRSELKQSVERPLITLLDNEGPRYGSPQLINPRLGQGLFRISVLDAYSRACTVTNEHSLPALEACHIKAYEQNGPHEVSNGILLRSDLHGLFDQGYITVTEKYNLEVSARLKLDFDNGKTYYPFHGKQISLPIKEEHKPSKIFLKWHNEEKYLS